MIDALIGGKVFGQPSQRTGASKGRLRPDQTIVLERINTAGGLAFVAKNCNDVFAALKS